MASSAVLVLVVELATAGSVSSGRTIIAYLPVLYWDGRCECVAIWRSSKGRKAARQVFALARFFFYAHSTLAYRPLPTKSFR